MDYIRLAQRHIAGKAFRSFVVFLCAFCVAGFALVAVLLTRGTQDSLQLALNRLGADILVVPAGSQARVETALLMGTPAQAWMPADNLQQIAQIPGVAAASPQLFLASLANASCCSASELFVVAYDPETDFTISPWLRDSLVDPPGLGDSVGGDLVFVPEGEQNIRLYGYLLTLRGNLSATGSGLDQTLFLTFDTAADVARISYTQAEKPLEIPEDSISAVMVKVASGYDAQTTAREILSRVPGVTAVQSPDLFKSTRQQMTAVARSSLTILGTTGIFAVLLLALVFALAAHERRREIGILRALGATQAAVLRILLGEALILALAGGLTGTVLAALSAYLFRTFIVNSLHMPLLLPDIPGLLLLAAGSLAAALLTVLLAALLPAIRISRMEPSAAMRE